jgi:uncharacterized protein YbjT (DUF2867 family)
MTPEPSRQHPAPLVLLTGATGYVGGRVLKALESAGHRVRCLARRPEYLAPRVGAETEVVRGDCLDASTLGPALTGVTIAYYLVHSMGAGADFERRDREAAHNFGTAARAAGVTRIIYLGGLGSRADTLSPHLRSRHETGEILRQSGVPVTEFRAGIVLGSGSLSFELIRALVERLPVMICPRWVRTETQPIAVEDLVGYLVEALDLPPGPGHIFEVGGGEPVSYREIMLEYARQRGLRRWLVPVPLLTPYLSSLWLGLTSPLYARVGRKLIESLRNPTVVSDAGAREAFRIVPMAMPQAIARAIRHEDREFAATRWSDAVSSSALRARWGGRRFGTRLVDSRTRAVGVSLASAFAPIRRIGGRNGWYDVNRLWRVRGWLDLLVGGVGLRRGRRDDEDLAVGDAVDCWRVEAYEPNHRLRLASEMKLPGRAWLEFEVEPRGEEAATIRQTSIFDPMGLVGLIYWYAMYPLHAWVFRGMLDGIATRAEAGARRGFEASAP